MTHYYVSPQLFTTAPSTTFTQAEHFSPSMVHSNVPVMFFLTHSISFWLDCLFFFFFFLNCVLQVIFSSAFFIIFDWKETLLSLHHVATSMRFIWCHGRIMFWLYTNQTVWICAFWEKLCFRKCLFTATAQEIKTFLLLWYLFTRRVMLFFPPTFLSR